MGLRYSQDSSRYYSHLMQGEKKGERDKPPSKDEWMTSRRQGECGGCGGWGWGWKNYINTIQIDLWCACFRSVHVTFRERDTRRAAAAAALRIADHSSSAEPSVGLHFPLMVRDLFNFQSHKSLLRSSIITFVILWPLHLLLRHQCQWQWQHLNTWRPGRQAMGYFIGGAGG